MKWSGVSKCFDSLETDQNFKFPSCSEDIIKRQTEFSRSWTFAQSEMHRGLILPPVVGNSA